MYFLTGDVAYNAKVFNMLRFLNALPILSRVLRSETDTDKGQHEWKRGQKVYNLIRSFEEVHFSTLLVHERINDHCHAQQRL